MIVVIITITITIITTTTTTTTRKSDISIGQSKMMMQYTVIEWLACAGTLPSDETNYALPNELDHFRHHSTKKINILLGRFPPSPLFRNDSCRVSFVRSQSQSQSLRSQSFVGMSFCLVQWYRPYQ